jgi:hypothetical protein
MRPRPNRRRLLRPSPSINLKTNLTKLNSAFNILFMRAELERILTQRYGETALPSVKLLEPTSQQIEEYRRHLGLTSFHIELSENSHLIVIDTANLRPLRNSWIRNRQRESLRLVVSSGIQPVTATRLQADTYDQMVEGLELTIHYSRSHNPEVPYTDTLKPLW